ncbi:MAG: FAD-binding oxidoreductase [Pirellulaceae bacterium]
MDTILLGIGLVIVVAVVCQTCAIATMTTTNHRSVADRWRRWCQRSETLLEQQVTAAQQACRFQAAWRGWRSLRVVHIEQVSGDCKSFILDDPTGTPLPSFLPGQFLMVGRTSESNEKPNASRCYSLSDAPLPSLLRITVKRVEGGTVSPWLHDTIKIGDRLQTRAPAGRFVLDLERRDLFVGIAAGVGITPIASMARYIARMQPSRPMIVFLSARDGDHAPLQDELRQLERQHPNLTLVVLYSRPKVDEDFDLKGRLNIDIIRQVVGEPKGCYYLCGPIDFMTTLSRDLIQWGIDESSVSFESFGDAPPATNVNEPHEPPTQTAVKLQRSGRRFVYEPSDGNLLDAAEREGIVLEADCRSGACGTCVRKLLSGKVRYDRPPSYAPLSESECLPCVAQPTEEIVLDA